ELWTKCGSTGELAQTIKNKDAHYRVIRRIMDPSGFIENQHDDALEKSVADKMAKHGLSYVPASKTRSLSNKRLEDAIDYVQLPSGHMAKPPELYVFSTCVRTIYAIEHGMWDERVAKAGEKADAKAEPVDKDATVAA